MISSSEVEPESLPTPSQLEIVSPSESIAPARQIIRKVADEIVNLSIKIGGRELLDKYIEDYEVYNGKG